MRHLQGVWQWGPTCTDAMAARSPSQRQEVAEAGVEQENVKQRLDALRS